MEKRRRSLKEQKLNQNAEWRRAGVRVVGCGWREVAERCLGPGSMANNGGRAGGKEGG